MFPPAVVEIQLEGRNGEAGEIKYLYVSDVNELQDYLRDKSIEYQIMDVPRESLFMTTIMPMLIMLAGIRDHFLSYEPAGRRSQFQGHEFRQEPGKDEYGK